jgi:hypothetical protein
MPVNRVRCASRYPRHGNGPGCSRCYWLTASSGWKASWTQRMGRRPSNLRRRAPPLAATLLMNLCVSRR